MSLQDYIISERTRASGYFRFLHNLLNWGITLSNMMSTTLNSCGLHHAEFLHSGISEKERALMGKLDQLAQSSSTNRHFAQLYLHTTRQAILFYQQADPVTRNFIERLEIRFAQYFFMAIENDGKGQSQAWHWRPYFSYQQLKPAQYYLIGANAHINGDIWKSLVHEFSYEEIKQQQENFLRFSESLKPVFQFVYGHSLRSSFLLRCIHVITGGRSRHFGFRLVQVWRRRQISLALLYFTHPHLFRKKEKSIRRAIAQFNKFVVNWI